MGGNWFSRAAPARQPEIPEDRGRPTGTVDQTMFFFLVVKEISLIFISGLSLMDSFATSVSLLCGLQL